MTACSVPDCDGPATHRNGLCHPHDERRRVYGHEVERAFPKQGSNGSGRSAFEQRLADEKVAELKALTSEEQLAYAQSIIDRRLAESAGLDIAELMQPGTPCLVETVRGARSRALTLRERLRRD